MARIEVDSIVGMEGEVAESILSDDNIIATYSNASLGREIERPEPQEQSAEAEESPSEFRAHGDDLLNEAIREQENDVVRFGDEAQEEREEQRLPEKESFDINDAVKLTPEEIAELRQQEQAHEPTEQEIHAGVEKLEADVKQLGLNDPSSAREFADEFCSAFGTSVYNSNTNVEALGNVMAKATLSAVQLYDAIARGQQNVMPEVPPAAAKEFTRDFLSAWGVDPRQITTPVNETQLANTVFYGLLNLFDTYQRNGGRVTDVSKLNHPEAAEQFLQNFIGSFGVTGKVDRQAAIKFADACAKQALGILGKLRTAAAARAQEQQRPARRSGQRVPKQFREGIKGQAAPKFQTNADIFNGAAESWRQLHGRL